MFDTFYLRLAVDHVIGNGYSFALTDDLLVAACMRIFFFFPMQTFAQV